MSKKFKRLWWRVLKAYAKGKMKKAQRLEDEAMWLLFEIREKENRSEYAQRNER